MSDLLRIDPIENNDNGLLLHWPLDEGSGPVAVERLSGRADSVEHVLRNPPFAEARDPQWRAGPGGEERGSLLLDGYSTFIGHPIGADEAIDRADGLSALSVGAWIAPRSYEHGDPRHPAAIAARCDRDAGRGFLLGTSRHGSWTFQFGLSDGRWIELWAPDEDRLPKGQWSHAYGVFDGQAGTAKLYLNGREAASLPVPQSSRLMPASGTELWIGRHPQGVRFARAFERQRFAGLLGGLRIYGRALAETEIAEAYTGVRRACGGDHPPLGSGQIRLDRSALASDRHRPQYHAHPPAHWMNEPHAPVYFEGKYHLFYQHNPQGPFFHHLHWGHWISEDLVHWRDLPVALAPEDDGLAADGIWSGSASYDADGLPVLFFTAGHAEASPDQSVALARSTYAEDGDAELVRWTKHPAPLIVQQPDQGRFGDFRDPFVWREGDRWYALVGSGTAEGGGTAFAYVSTDLLNWTYKGPFYIADMERFPYLGPIWELPVLLPLGRDAGGAEKHLLLISPVGAGADVEVFYWIGTLDRESLSFVPDDEEPQLIDVGDFHFTGPSGMVDPKTGRLIVFTIAQGDRTPEMEYASGWAHNAGLPLQVWLREDGRLGLGPIEELESLRGEKLADLRDVGADEANRLLSGIEGDMLEIKVELRADGADRWGLAVRRSPGGEEETMLFYDSAESRLGVDRSKTTLDPREQGGGVQSGRLDLGGDTLKLHVYLDRSMIEAYANGLKSVTTRAYPSRTDALGLQVRGNGGVQVMSLEIWEMRSIWEVG
ncbi:MULTISPECIES: GH32 C-terminal domain-containing protein [Saccharibacillus]|uniref:GH32 C-terminal domain-containing protein n=1 Tax=Saccharibacillus TaxID=456492 RepID=UPI00123B0689|nr:GH32 C-terminal domain-containing protein [Saccharibacillus sp. WB 17]MWJ31444.1 glycoside hydrolase [Saccharibacillus sp. WB 17]